MSCQVDQLDLSSIALRYMNGGGKVFGNGVVESYLPIDNHLRQQQRSKNFRNGTNLENGTAVKRPVTPWFRRP
jgi:hypothetical protein